MKREDPALTAMMRSLSIGVLGFLLGVGLMSHLNTNQKRELDAAKVLIEDQSNLYASQRVRTAELYQRVAVAEANSKVSIPSKLLQTSQPSPPRRTESAAGRLALAQKRKTGSGAKERGASSLRLAAMPPGRSKMKVLDLVAEFERPSANQSKMPLDAGLAPLKSELTQAMPPGMRLSDLSTGVYPELAETIVTANRDVKAATDEANQAVEEAKREFRESIENAVRELRQKHLDELQRGLDHDQSEREKLQGEREAQLARQQEMREKLREEREAASPKKSK